MASSADGMDETDETVLAYTLEIEDYRPGFVVRHWGPIPRGKILLTASEKPEDTPDSRETQECYLYVTPGDVVLNREKQPVQSISLLPTVYFGPPKKRRGYAVFRLQIVNESDEPAAEPADEPADEPAAEPADEPADEPAAEPADEPADEPEYEPFAEYGDELETLEGPAGQEPEN